MGGYTLHVWVLGILRTPYPEGPSTRYLRTLVPNTMKSMVFWNQTPQATHGVLGPSGFYWALEPECQVKRASRNLNLPSKSTSPTTAYSWAFGLKRPQKARFRTIRLHLGGTLFAEGCEVRFRSRAKQQTMKHRPTMRALC